MMNRENEEQKPVAQSLCGALQKEANCKCLVLSVLIYGCLAAVTWCRCANVSKIVINFSSYPIKTTKYVSPCDEGYIYIPVAFMGMLYLVYLVECYHSPIRIDLLHAENQSGVLAKLTQLKLAQPTIWWKAISYHYVRRKRQIMRYRNGDNFTTTQVYYERVNSHAATSFYFYDYCGSKDISKELLLDPKIPITKITLSKGFAFSNVRSATEFEEARSRFFAEQEFRDDYMEMREGLDLGCNFSPITLVAVLGNPWFTRSYVYWCLSALLLSWPLRIIIECNTQYVDYQVTKLFGVNYDTPTNIQIHTSPSQLSAPGSYMLAPSYSEALLMEPAVSAASNPEPQLEPSCGPSDLVPSYSEALLYERAQPEHQPGADFYELEQQQQQQQQHRSAVGCECPCHGLADHRDELAAASQESLQLLDERRASPAASGRQEDLDAPTRHTAWQQEAGAQASASLSSSGSSRAEARICESCLKDGATERRSDRFNRRSASSSVASSSELELSLEPSGSDGRRCILREYSEPDLRRNLAVVADCQANVLRANGRSLENIMENEETENPLSLRTVSRVLEASPQSAAEEEEQPQQPQQAQSSGAIPKRRAESSKVGENSSSSSRVTVNPIAEAVKRMPSSRSTYFCLKSILKQNRRRFTLVTPEELQSLTGLEQSQLGEAPPEPEECSCDGCRAEPAERPASLRIAKQRPLSCQSLTYTRHNSRTLIFASPIQVVCPSDPFGGRNVVTSENPPGYEDALDMPVLSRLRRSLTDRDSAGAGTNVAAAAAGATSESSSSGVTEPATSSNAATRADRAWRHRRTLSTDPQQLACFGGIRDSEAGSRTALIRSRQQGNSETAISLPSYDGLTMPPDSLSGAQTSGVADERSPFLRLDELAAAAAAPAADASLLDSARQNGTAPDGMTKSHLRRSLTERRSTPAESRRHDHVLRKSFTERVDTGLRIAGVKRTNINIETSL